MEFSSINNKSTFDKKIRNTKSNAARAKSAKISAAQMYAASKGEERQRPESPDIKWIGVQKTT